MFSILKGANLLPAAAILLTHLCYLLPSAYVAWRCTLWLQPRSVIVQCFEAGVCYLLLAVTSIGLLGGCRILGPTTLFLLLWILAACLFLFGPRRNNPAPRNPGYAALLGSAIAAGYLLIFYDIFALLPSLGTDAMLYHLFYPTTWLAEGNIDRIPQQGLVTAAYACYGELVYAFHLVPTGHEFFSRTTPFLFLFIGAAALLTAARTLHRAPAAGAAAALLWAGCDIFIANASVANTDIFLGAELTAAVVLALLALQRRNKVFWLLAGLMLGFAPATKLLGILLAPPLWLAIALPVLLFCGKRGVRPVGWLTLGAAVAAAPYYIVNWFVTGSPAYPQKIALFGRPIFDAYLVTAAAPPVGWNQQTWHFFVGPDAMRLPFITALVILISWLIGTLTAAFFACRCRRGRAENLVLASVGGMLAVMTVVQCLVYPARTQPRQIIPILMLMILTGIPFWDLLSRRGRGWFAVAAAFGCAVLGELPRLRALPILPEMALSLVVLSPFFFAHVHGSRRRRLLLWSLAAAGAFLLVMLRFAQSNHARERLAKPFLPPESLQAVKLLQTLDPQERGLRIAYTGIHYGLYTGISGRNQVRSVPVSKSGLAGAWHYRTFEEERCDGGFELYLERLRKGKFQYLLCEPHHFDAPRPELEVRWALAHPQELPLLYHEGGLWLFAVTPGEREAKP